MADAGGPAYHYVCGAAVGPTDQGPLAPVPAAAHASPEEASCPCLICHEVCVLGPLRLTFLAWLSAASCMGVCAYYVFAVDPAAAAVFGLNAVVFWQLWWRTSGLRAAASADMLMKVFGFTFFVGGLLASLVEVVLLLAEGSLLFNEGEDVSKVPAWCATASSFAPERCQGALQAREAAANATELYVARYGYHRTHMSCEDSGDSIFGTCTCDIGNVPPPCPWLHGQEQITEAEYQTRLPAILQQNCTELRHILYLEANPAAIPGQLHVSPGVVIFLLLFGYIDAATVEEGIKLLAARGQRCPCSPLRCHPCCVPGWPGPLKEAWSYILYMVAAAAGFSTVENLLYLFPMQPTQSDLYPACVAPPSVATVTCNICGRLLLAYPLHLICGAMTGVQLIR